jgi:hypothetical protein
MRMLALSALLMATVASGRPPEETSAALENGRELTRLFLQGKLEPLWAKAGPSMRRQFGTLEGFAGFARKVKNDFGVELRVSAEKTQERGAQTVYSRLSVFSLFARGVELQWIWDANGQLVFASARPAVTEAPSPHENTTPKTALRLPVEGAWNVLWGGRTWEDNRHASVADQRYALDLLIWKTQGTFEGDGTRNEQYFCWGKPVVAPAEGKVVIAEDGASDNTPGIANPQKLYGNHVVIDHGNGEYSLLAHLMRGSLAVKIGAQVQASQLLGRTGNSGLSTEPHLHFQLMDSARWLEAHGLPSVFVDFTADGKPVARGEPKRGQTVSARVSSN